MTKNLNFKWRGVFRLSATFLIASICLLACKKKVTTVGVHSIDPSEILQSGEIDTFTINTFTFQEDSIKTSNPLYALLGSYVDPVFGKVDASLYTQFALPSTNFNFEDFSAITIDSVVLGLAYRGFYGVQDAQTFEVYQITEDLSLDSTYYQFSSKAVNSTNLVVPGYEVITPNVNDVTVVGADTVESQLRLRLDNSLATSVFAEAENNPSTFQSQANFKSYFKGLHVKVNNPSQQANEGGVFYFSLNSSNSEVTIFYKQNGESKTYTLEINSSCADFNHIDFDMTGTAVANQIADSTLGNVSYYAQALNLRAAISLPNLSSIPKNAVIHKAMLYLPVQYQTGYKYQPTDRLFIKRAVNASGSEIDDLRIGAIYDDYFNHYAIDIRSYVQSVVWEKYENTYLLANPDLFNTSVNRMIFNGRNTNNKKKPKLVILYTTF
jgi:hypothetical protein